MHKRPGLEGLVGVNRGSTGEQALVRYRVERGGPEQ